MVFIARLWINIDRKRSDFFEFFYLSILLIWLSGCAALCDAKSSGVGLQVALVIGRLSPPSPTRRVAARLFYQPALLQDHSYQLILVDLSLAFGFQPAYGFVMLDIFHSSPLSGVTLFPANRSTLAVGATDMPKALKASTD